MSFFDRLRSLGGLHRRRGRRVLVGAAFSMLLGLALLLTLDRSRDLAGSDAERDRGERPASAQAWKQERARLDETQWAGERLAQQYEATLVALWDALLAAGRRGDEQAKRLALAGVAFEALRVGTPYPVEALELGIERQAFGAPQRTLAPHDWAELLEALEREGFRLAQSEWHHAKFAPPTPAGPARSEVSLVLHVVDPAHERRIAIDGELAVEWSESRDARGNPIPAKIDATGLRIWTRSGPVSFERILSFDWPVRGGLSRLHPVLIYDLDGDGLQEIILLGAAQTLWNQGQGRFRHAPLLEQPDAFAEAGVIADLDGDGHPDLLAARARGDLALYRGDGTGRFAGEPLVTPRFEEPLRGPSALSVGDVDADGDLDVWLAQYQPAYRDGQMPTPFYDANDGHPSHLLLNDGSGSLQEATEPAGLAAKRFRRTYASSFVDLDEDGDLDLLVVSDYSGIDLHHNDGRGHFSDANDTLRADRHLFGMSSAFADFDLDGRLDFFVAGMASTTARRLEALGLGRSDRPDAQQMRMRMAFGNRMYLASDGGWREPEFREEVARTGWTWGTTAFDVDNDGDPDLFAANGHA
ncbi:MAG: VCBS repeat-containing protein, partial [Myxococcales bacterium]